MTNEVRIDVTGKETAGSTLDAVRAKSRSLSDSVKALNFGVRDGAAASRAWKAASSGLTEEQSRSISTVKALDGQIKTLRASLADLAIAYAATAEGDTNGRDKIKEQIAAQRSALKEGLNLRALLPAAADTGRKLGEALGSEAGPKVVTGIATRLASSGGGLGVAAAPMLAGLATFAGATIAGAIIGGVGVGGVVGGLAAASGHSAVRSSATALADEFRVAGEQAGAHMVGPAVEGIGILRSHLRSAQGDMDRIVAASGRFVRPLAEGVGQGARSLLQGVADVAERAEPAVRAIGDGIARIGDAAGDGLSSLADNAASGGRALAMTFGIVEAGTRTIFDLINGLTELYGWLELGSAVWTGNTDGLARMVVENEKAKEGNTSFAESLQDVLAGFRDTETEAQEAAQAIRDYHDALDQIVDQNLDAAEANLRYRDTLKEAKDAADDRKKVSRDEEEALLKLARGANTVTEALEAQGASSAVLSARNKEARADFVDLAMEMGHGRTKANELADAFLKVPTSRNSTINVDTDQAARNLRHIIELAAKIRSKSVTITTFNNQVITRSEGRNVGIGDGVGGRAHGGITGAAAGGIRGALTWVGERGPELLDLPPGTMVHPAGTSQRMAEAAATPTAGIIINGPVILQGVQRPEDLVRGLQEYTLRNGVIRGVAITP